MKTISSMGYAMLPLLCLTVACKDPLPASSQKQALTLELGQYMNLSFCDELSEGEERDVRVYVHRDEYRGNGVIEYDVSAGVYYLTNDMLKLENIQISDPDRFGVPPEIPESGSYGLRVSAQGRDCYTCCDGPSCSTGLGEPAFQSSTIELNKDHNPSTLYMRVKYRVCE